VDHASWLLYCLKSVTNRHGDLCDLASPVGSGALMDSTLIPTNTATTTMPNGSAVNLEQVCMVVNKRTKGAVKVSMLNIIK
jgi:hypothetical protein